MTFSDGFAATAFRQADSASRKHWSYFARSLPTHLSAFASHAPPFSAHPSESWDLASRIAKRTVLARRTESLFLMEVDSDEQFLSLHAAQVAEAGDRFCAFSGGEEPLPAAELRDPSVLVQILNI